MLTAAIVLFTARHSTAVEMLDAFARQSSNMELHLTAHVEGESIPLVWQVERGRLQNLQAGTSPQSERFIQLEAGILAITDYDQQYDEYGNLPFLVPVPEELSLTSSIFPSGLLALVRDQKSTNAKESGPRVARTVQQSEDTTTETSYIFNEAGVLTQIKTSLAGGPIDSSATYDVNSIRFGQSGLGAMKYRPPLGYTPSKIPVTQRPAISGQKMDLDRWGNLDVRALNRKGIVVVFTAPDCLPSTAMAPVLNKLSQQLAKQNVKLVEVWLGNSKLPKRNWPIVADTQHIIEGMFQPPVTPYLFAVDANATVLGAWAGYAPDQESAMIASVSGRFKSR